MDEAKNGDRLEQLAREAAEGAQFEFNPSAWEAMEQKLDAPKKGFFWWKLGGALSVLVVIILLIIYMPSGSSEGELASNASTKENALENDNQSKKDQEGVPAKSNERDSINGQSVDAKASSELEVSSDKQETSTTSLPTSTDEVAGKTEEALKEPNAVPKSNEQTVKSSTTESANALVNNASKKTTQSEASTSNAMENSKVQRSALNNDATNKSEGTTYFDATQPISLTDSIDTETTEPYGIGLETITPRWKPSIFLFDLSLKPMTSDASYYQTADLDSLQTFKKWSFGVLVSLDLSATGFDGFTNPGTMLGLMAEYRLTNKWSLQSGLSYSVKNYRALGDEYDTSTWPGGRADNLVSALARCLVIDIPINVRRYFTTKSENQWFVSSGVSTYFMLREDYDFEYATQNPNWSPTGQIRGGNNHFLGVANFSVGYETPLSKKLGLAVEPFMKLPLTGIGQGQVKFLSFGANVAIKLR